MKLLFLDVDGVLNHEHSPCWTENGHRNLDRDCLVELNRVLTVTEAKVVMSSVWRHGNGMQLVAAELPPGSIVGATPAHRLTDRKMEILDWLWGVWPLSHGAAETLEGWAVVDDEADADLGDGSFFKTDFSGGGLTRRIANGIIAHLGAAERSCAVEDAEKAEAQLVAATRDTETLADRVLRELGSETAPSVWVKNAMALCKAALAPRSPEGDTT